MSVGRGCCWGGGGGVVVLSVVGRVLMQVGCKKFATTPRLGSVQETTDCGQRAPRSGSYQALRYRMYCQIAREKTASSKWSCLSIALRQAKYSRLVSSCLARLTKRIFGVSTFRKSKSRLRRQTDGLVPVLRLLSPLGSLM